MTLEVEGLSVAYRTLRGDLRAVDGVTFSIADGEIMGLAGESGSGKSTLGNSLIYLEGRMKHAGGTVRLDGKVLPISDRRAMNAHRLREVSIIPQYAMSALNPTRKIGRMTADLLKSRGVRYESVLDEFKRRVDLVGLPESVLGMYPFELSGGMRQRATMVISTLLNPSLLIADEVTSALDVSTQRAVGEMLMEFRDRGFVKTMVVITHDLSILAQVADTITVMYAGKLVEKAPASTLVDHPLHPYTQLLLASLPEVGLRYDQAALVGIPGRPPSLLRPPEGCRFRARCPFAFEKCSEEPPFVELRPGHQVACWKAMREASTGGAAGVEAPASDEAAPEPGPSGPAVPGEVEPAPAAASTAPAGLGLPASARSRGAGDPAGKGTAPAGLGLPASARSRGAGDPAGKGTAPAGLGLPASARSRGAGDPAGKGTVS
jgi:peptide/nickel transport system ATP-binding protein